jgi:pimeloyl-ACP methyl ester carboxylesterase
VNGPDEVDPDPGAFVDLRVEGPEGGVAVRGRGLDGAARPVLALPGLGSNARLWDALAWRLAAAGHPVAVLDLPGHGSSDRPARGFSWPGLVAAVTGVCASRAWTGDARRPVLAGHHLGADLAVEVAAAHPGLAEALVLMDGGATELSGRFADWPTCEVALAPSVPEGSDGARTARMLRAVHADWPDDALAGALADLDWHHDGHRGSPPPGRGSPGSAPPAVGPPSRPCAAPPQHSGDRRGARGRRGAWSVHRGTTGRARGTDPGLPDRHGDPDPGRQ